MCTVTGAYKERALQLVLIRFVLQGRLLGLKPTIPRCHDHCKSF